MIESGLDIEKEYECNRTLIEKATIAGNIEMIKYLYSKGAALRNSLKYAEENPEFFEEHKQVVELIKSFN